MFYKGDPDNKSATITAENQFTDALELTCGEAASVSIIYGTLAATTLVVQRKLPGQATWQDITDENGASSYTASVEGDFVATERCLIRVGCKTGGFGSGSGTVRVGKG